MRLMFFVQMLDPEDAIRGFIVGWVRALAKEVDELVVLSQDTRYLDVEDNVRVISLGKETGASKWRQGIILAKRLYQEILGSKTDAVLTHMTPIYSVACAPFTFLGGTPLFTWYTHRQVSTTLRLAEKFSRLCFTASESSFRLPSKKRRVVGHGIDINLFCQRRNLIRDREGPLRLLSASRLSPVKRVDVLLDALSNLPGDWSLDLAGDAPLGSQKAYEERVYRLAGSLGDRVRVHGAIPHPQMPAFLRQGDLFINLSGTGSLDKGVLEALSVGCTVLTGNEAFREFLEGTLERTYLEEVNVESVRSRLRTLMDCPRPRLQEDRDRLYERVRSEHSLQGLARRLVAEMKREISSKARNQSGIP